MTNRIGIDINGVLRDTITKFGQLYEKHLIESDPNGYVGKHIMWTYRETLNWRYPI